MKVTLLIPTLNEIEGMKAIMPRIRKEWCDQILIVDGGSKDGTVEYARTLGFPVVFQTRKGLRHAYTAALPHIKGDVLITFSPDGNSVPEVIPRLIEKIREGYDMIIASRYLGGAKSEDDDFLTSFGNWFFTTATNLLFGGRYTDCMVMFRAYKTRLIYDLEIHKDSGYWLPEKLFFTVVGSEPLLSLRAAKRRLKVAEIPGDEPKRIGGTRKLQIFRWGAAHVVQFIQELFYWH